MADAVAVTAAEREVRVLVATRASVAPPVGSEGVGLVEPARVTLGRPWAYDEERSASRLELFFDLAFVLVIAELAIALRADVTPTGTLWPKSVSRWTPSPGTCSPR